VKHNRVAFFSPLKPDRTGVADYAEKLLPLLTNHFDIDVYVEKILPSNSPVSRCFKCYTRRDYELQTQKTPYDLNIYQIGNSHFHRYIYPVMVRYPGAVILHDANIHHSRAFAHLHERNLVNYLDEITWSHGDEGLRIGPAIAHGYHSPVLYDMFPMLRLIGESAASVLVHNRFAEERIQKHINSDRIFRIHLPYTDQDVPDYQKVRNDLGIDPDEFVIASFGFLTPEKRLLPALNAFDVFRREHARSRYVLVGECLENDYGKELRNRAATIPNVHITGYVDDDTFKKWLAASDVSISLRYPTQGESSDVLIRIMGAGKPVIIPAYRQFLEIPSNACIQIPLWPNEAYSVLVALRELIHHTDAIKSIGSCARQYIQENHSPRKWIESVTKALNETLTLPDITPLSQRCGLKHIRTLPVEESLAWSIASWGDIASHPCLINPLATAIEELGINDIAKTR
jgi:glycosyltransferase involved in cell wall biosynthesis